VVLMRLLGNTRYVGLPITTDPRKRAESICRTTPCHQGHPNRRPAASDDERDADVKASANAR
jgi:hypothetical protein